MVRIGRWVLFERAAASQNMTALFHDLSIDFLRIEHIQAYITAYPCPKCQTKEQLKILDYELGTQGWEINVRCQRCHSQGIFNDTGFHFKVFNGEQVK